jgi:septal ring factor EnvC (AmiA/AmiB activator)
LRVVLENSDTLDARDRELLELHSRLNVLRVSYDEIASNKSSLEFEINTYRRLLESEEAHVKKINDSSSSLRQTSSLISTAKTTTSFSSNQGGYSPPVRPAPLQPMPVPDTKINQTEMQAKTTFQRSAKGSFDGRPKRVRTPIDFV